MSDFAASLVFSPPPPAAASGAPPGLQHGAGGSTGGASVGLLPGMEVRVAPPPSCLLVGAQLYVRLAGGGASDFAGLTDQMCRYGMGVCARACSCVCEGASPALGFKTASRCQH